MEKRGLDPRLRLFQQANMKGKVVLVRVDHNVVKNGTIKDPYRIEATLGTLYAIAEKGGRAILMTHVGRPRDKKTAVKLLVTSSCLLQIAQRNSGLTVGPHTPFSPILTRFRP